MQDSSALESGGNGREGWVAALEEPEGRGKMGAGQVNGRAGAALPGVDRASSDGKLS